MKTPEWTSLWSLLVLLGVGACALVAPTPTPRPPDPTSTPVPTVTPSPVPPTATPTPTPTPVAWTLVWSDEFDGPHGSGVDPTKWKAQTGGSGWGNAELEYYTDRLENAYIDHPAGGDGVLVIQANKEKYEQLAYTSARLITEDKFEFTYGRVEARLKIPFGQGLWPAFWMLGTTAGWPHGGEIDIMENIGKEFNTIHGTIHGPGYSGAHGLGAPISLPDGSRWSDNFHVFAVEWEPNVIRWYADDQLYLTLTPADIPAGTTWVFDHPFYLLLNVAVGGGWPGYPDSTSTFPQQMRVDYVRVYARPEGWPTAVP